ncbi:MAG TPA: PPOX class F420-dependent oxidoreductase [Anaerolineales bacterium]|nr:PPOX class F420-dependent oxidoreductase [Anaerolineales bacterium]
MPALVPASHQDLLGDQARALAFLATTCADGAPQVTPVWFDVAGELIRVNTARGRLKYKNMLRRPQVALAIGDREDPYRYIQVRGTVVASTEEGARDHISLLAKKYRGWDTYPIPEGQVRVIFLIRPDRVSVHS